MATDSFQVTPPSLDGSASTLLELAGLLQAGRPEPSLTAHVQDPKAHPDVVAANDDLATFAADQYRDAVALLAALSTRLAAASGEYAGTDEDTAGHIRRLLTQGELVPADERGG